MNENGYSVLENPQKVIAAHLPKKNKNMKVICRKCGEYFIKHTKNTTLCNSCWDASHRSEKLYKSRIKRCELCNEPVLFTEPRVHINYIDHGKEFKITNLKTTVKGFYHRSCWEKEIAPVISSVSKRKKDNLSIREVIPHVYINKKENLVNGQVTSSLEL